MNLILVGFSQDVSLESPEDVQYHLVLKRSDGATIRLPVQEETTRALIESVYAGKEQPVSQLEQGPAEMTEEVVPEQREPDNEELGQTFQMPETGDPDLDGPDLLSRVPPGVIPKTRPGAYSNSIAPEEEEEELYEEEEEEDVPASEEEIPSL
jgi:hypothetical protein